ncbi:hypothetical protein [Marinobacterium stanieri]|uniref:Uncharacterized protein n=1 Tax=Marinobacterium stanieri TaxID=49186 RepID=A0A1N6XL31_9GAMM|nr:hypothetical protein [Marinobacterium stanieri]SIR02951.1 hypothetical protein SAMN05421647_11481 [Marinobacterium stanieri]
MNTYTITTQHDFSFTLSAADSDFAVWAANDKAKALQVPAGGATLWLHTQHCCQKLGDFNLESIEKSVSEQLGIFKNLEQAPSEYSWTGRDPVPRIHERVCVRVNGLGPGIVVGYQIDNGYLALIISVDRLPEHFNTHIKARRNVELQCFGSEINSLMSGAI